MNINSTIVSKPPVATEKDLRRCKVIEGLLVQLLGVLPTEIGDSIRPITIGFFQRVSTLLKPDASVTTLRRAIGAYVHSKRYYLGCSQADAMRHGLDGNPVEPVSDLIDSPLPGIGGIKQKRFDPCVSPREIS